MSNEINLFEEELEVVETPENEIQPTSLEALLGKIKQRQDHREKITEEWANVKKIVEALLFASRDPLPLRKIRDVTDTAFPFKPRHLLGIIEELKKEYEEQERAFRLEEIGQGYILRTLPKYGAYLNTLYRNKRLEKLSQAATEVLAIIAYKQPITRPAIEAIRGVDSSGTVQNLLERELIEGVGRLEAPGRPTLYAVTPQFYKYFGINDIQDLPKDELQARDEESRS